MRRLIMASCALSLMFLSAPAYACTPCPQLSDEDSFRQADAVVVGVVTDLDTLFTSTATLGVEEAVKGELPKTLTLPEHYEPPCGAHLSEGHRYRLFLVRDDDVWAKIPCAANTRLSEEPVLPWWRIHNEAVTAVGSLAAVAVLLTGIIWVRRRRDHPAEA